MHESSQPHIKLESDL